uniref:Uncharacterized protein n=1 Tax=Oryza meridionalis TaxID=40149 RepID=A0A0E0E2A5_9ORYZ
MAMPELVQILRAQPGPFPPRPCRYRVCPRALSSVSPRCVILKLIQSMNARSVIVQLVASIVGGPQIRPEAPPSRSLRARLSADPLLLALDPLSTDPRAAASSLPEPAATIQGSNSLSAILSWSSSPDALKSGQP